MAQWYDRQLKVERSRVRTRVEAFFNYAGFVSLSSSYHYSANRSYSRRQLDLSTFALGRKTLLRGVF